MSTAKQPKNKFEIKVSKNGPYIVSGGVPLSKQIVVPDDEGYAYDWREGTKYSLQAKYVLCRCGESTTMPFCDGTHAKVGFDGTETASREMYITQAKKIDGPALTLYDVEELCAVIGFCDRAGGVWNLIEQSDEPEAKRIAIEETINCPAGRLVVRDKEGKEIEPEYEPSIGLVEDPQAGVNGPIWVRGGIPIIAAEGSIYEVRNRVTLCGCGRSANKPFCDGSHCTINE
ncbi:CDGSH iron-sulfur domain-containing protein [Chloroflexota bacterium]